MKQLFATLCLALFVLSSWGQTFRNPVIPGYHPDPSVCRVGQDFYLVNSSFQYFPGVPIFHSRDMVHWQQLGNVLSRRSQLNLEGATSWTGIYAPTIRYHRGTLYMVTTNVGNGGNFFVTAKKPEGPWSDPIWLEQGGIDPSLYFEGDNCWLVSNPDGWIVLSRIDPQTGKTLTPPRRIWQGTGGRYPEGPHIYKKDGWYWLLISEGGTELAHGVTIARSRDIAGPYEAAPHNPIMTNCRQAGESKQIQGTGHADMVQAADGSWWTVFLAYRNFNGSYHHLGRETCLAPVEWPKGQWPTVNGGQPIDTLMTARTLPVWNPVVDEPRFAPNDPAWLYIQNPDSSRYQWLFETKSTQPSALLLKGSALSLTANNRPTFIGRRQEAQRMAMEVSVLPQDDGVVEAGLTVYQMHSAHYDLSVCRLQDGRTDVVLGYDLGGLPRAEVCRVRLSETEGGQPVALRVRSDEVNYIFEYRLLGGSAVNGGWHEAGRLPANMLSTEVAGGFTGVVVGMYATGEGSARFASWRYVQLKATP